MQQNFSEEHKVAQIILKFDDSHYKPSETDFKEILNAILKTSGSIITKIQEKACRLNAVHSYLCQKLINFDKAFYQALFSQIKSSIKWQNSNNQILLIGLIPKILSIHALQYFKEKSDDRVQMIEVLMFTLQSEYLEKLNQQLQKEPDGSDLLKLFPDLKKRFEYEWKDQKGGRYFNKIQQITSANIQETYEFLLELYYSCLFQIDESIIEDFIQMGLILCGAQLGLEQLTQKKIDYKNTKFSIFIVQLSDKCLEVLLLISYSIATLQRKTPHIDLLIDMLLKKNSNESRFHLAGLSQSVKELTENIYEGVF